MPFKRVVERPFFRESLPPDARRRKREGTLKGILCKVVLATIVAELSVGCSPVGDADGDWFVVPDRFTSDSNDASVGTSAGGTGGMGAMGGTGGSAGNGENDAGPDAANGDSGSSLASDSGVEAQDASPDSDGGSQADSGTDGGT